MTKYRIVPIHSQYHSDKWLLQKRDVWKTPFLKREKFSWDVIGTFTCLEEAKDMIEHLKKDIIYLD